MYDEYVPSDRLLLWHFSLSLNFPCRFRDTITIAMVRNITVINSTPATAMATIPTVSSPLTLLLSTSKVTPVGCAVVPPLLLWLDAPCKVMVGLGTLAGVDACMGLIGVESTTEVAELGVSTEEIVAEVNGSMGLRVVWSRTEVTDLGVGSDALVVGVTGSMGVESTTGMVLSIGGCWAEVGGDVSMDVGAL